LWLLAALLAFLCSVHWLEISQAPVNIVKPRLRADHGRRSLGRRAHQHGCSGPSPCVKQRSSAAAIPPCIRRAVQGCRGGVGRRVAAGLRAHCELPPAPGGGPVQHQHNHHGGHQRGGPGGCQGGQRALGTAFRQDAQRAAGSVGWGWLAGLIVQLAVSGLVNLYYALSPALHSAWLVSVPTFTGPLRQERSPLHRRRQRRQGPAVSSPGGLPLLPLEPR
jgi:hypothetical protein